VIQIVPSVPARIGAGELIDLERLLPCAMAIQNEQDPADQEVVVTTSDNGPGVQWILTFCPLDHCFYVAVNGRERFRTDSPQLACVYFSSRAANR